jgi:hypothetical protein
MGLEATLDQTLQIGKKTTVQSTRFEESSRHTSKRACAFLGVARANTAVGVCPETFLLLLLLLLLHGLPQTVSWTDRESCSMSNPQAYRVLGPEVRISNLSHVACHAPCAKWPLAELAAKQPACRHTCAGKRTAH